MGLNTLIPPTPSSTRSNPSTPMSEASHSWQAPMNSGPKTTFAYSKAKASPNAKAFMPQPKGKGKGRPIPANPGTPREEELIPDNSMPQWDGKEATFNAWLTAVQAWKDMNHPSSENDWMEIGEKRKGGPNDEEDPDLTGM